MIIVLINWRIAPTKVDEFLEHWKEKLSLEGKPGLVGEFLSKVEGQDFHNCITWNMEADNADNEAANVDHVSYVNVGIWSDADAFHTAVGQYMPDGRKTSLTFEAAPRRRAILSPEAWRIGQEQLPATTSEDVRF